MKVRLKLPELSKLVGRKLPKFVGRIRLPTFPEPGSRWTRILTEVLWVGGGLALAGIAFVVSFFIAMRVEMKSTEVRVPDLTGMTLEAASREVEAQELVLQVVDQRNDPAIPSGRILQQAPPADVSVRRGRKIKLVMSLGGKVLNVPDVVGQAARTVEIELKQEGFVPGDEARIPSAVVPTGAVIAQVPQPDTPAVPASRVHRLVSTGAEIPVWIMPDLTGMDRAGAEAWLARNGFRRGAVRRVSMSGRRAGYVVGQLPLPGYPVRSNDVVDLTIAQ
ncbi:MAG: PASTA domain-containing protein [Acidobacteria bacterium]|nr:PASTA domain-containing protein [Acidobacteriota bacterium]NIM63359.1 PASTA domain-containing protein [Acidobacteriota bacterium]NIO60068.1 PASTA domain-containing protein [Acidobacteriota bacterium]NIQ31476.1 PASTA domain-containing protein [Acidobacteriota bacterium]NIQ86251.1 PASTA domain-containing protein [Acidobacteriota bacterium]